jgi:dTDP-glucose pyrophosphorylase
MNIARHLISDTESISFAMQRLNTLGDELTLFVVNGDGKLLGTVTDGDIRRGLLKRLRLDDRVSDCMNASFKFLKQSDTRPDKIQEYKLLGIKLLPVLDSSHRIVHILNLDTQATILPVHAVIIAGGEGLRLRPMTNETPKPLLKIGSKHIIDYGIERLIKYGINNILVCVNYLGQQIIDYLGDGSEKNISINYIKEDKKLGTIGAVTLAEIFKHESILVMNADLITNINLEDFYNQFITSNAMMSVACTPYKVDVPYAILDIDKDEVRSLIEKPTFDYYSNAGIYLIRKEAFRHIPHNTHYNATDLIEFLIGINKKVTYFPILGYWLDIGKMNDFQKAQEDIKYIVL